MSNILLNISRAAANNIFLMATRLFNDGGFNTDDIDAVTILDQMGDDPEVTMWVNQVANFLNMIIYIFNEENLSDVDMEI